MNAGDPYRRHNEPSLSEERLRRAQAACTSPDVSPLLERQGLPRAEVHELFNLARALVEALGDSMEEVWQTYDNVGRCAVCGQRRWSTLPDCHLDNDTPKGTRECNDCRHRWVPMKFDREAMVSGRLRHYIDQRANPVAGDT